MSKKLLLAMSVWGPQRDHPKKLRDIIAAEEAEAQDADLQEALQLSLVLQSEQETEDYALEAGIQASLGYDDASLALALELSDSPGADDASLALALEMSEAPVDNRKLARQREAAARHEKIRVVSREQLAESVKACEADDEADDGVTDVIRAERITIDAKAGLGLIGRRPDGTLVSKHDARLDARLKAQALHDTFDGAGDIAQARVPGRVYNDLLLHAPKPNAPLPHSSKGQPLSRRRGKTHHFRGFSPPRTSDNEHDAPAASPCVHEQQHHS